MLTVSVSRQYFNMPRCRSVLSFNKVAGVAELCASCRWHVLVVLCGADRTRAVRNAPAAAPTYQLAALLSAACPWLTAAPQSPAQRRRHRVPTATSPRRAVSTRVWSRCFSRSLGSCGPSSPGSAKESRPRCTRSARAEPAQPPLSRSFRPTVGEETTGITRRGPCWKISRDIKT